jgi:hypothetical protein
MGTHSLRTRLVVKHHSGDTVLRLSAGCSDLAGSRILNCATRMPPTLHVSGAWRLTILAFVTMRARPSQSGLNRISINSVVSSVFGAHFHFLMASTLPAPVEGGHPEVWCFSLNRLAQR